MLVSQTKAPVRLAASYAGLLNGSSGKTHQDLEDFAIMRAMPQMTVLAPADEYEAAAAIRWAADHDGPVYMRLARDPVEPVFDADFTFEPGLPRVVREGDGPLLISTGVQTSRVVEAAERLSAVGIECGVVHLGSLKPLDATAVADLISSRDIVVTVEEHSIINGLGSTIAEVIAEGRLRSRLHRIGLADGWSESAPNEFLLEKYGLSSERVASQVQHVLAD
jgi:transketolase